ncbi:hypothetical protein PHPOHJMI_02293 [Mannheimia haemolytica]
MDKQYNFTIHYSLFTIRYSLFTIHYSLFTIHYSLFTIQIPDITRMGKVLFLKEIL